MKSSFLLSVFLLFLPVSHTGAASWPKKEDSRVIPVYHANRVWNAVTTTTDGRVFVGFPSADGPGVQLEEMDSAGSEHPYPNKDWNQWRPGQPVTSAFVHVNAIRMGPDGKLWVVDGGALGIGKPAIPGAARLFCFDVPTGSLDRVYRFNNIAKPTTFIDDVRFNGGHAYLTDAGAPGIIVLDLKKGKARRLLDGDPSATDLRPLRADGKILRDEKGREVRVHADQLEVSPDGRYFYFQPASGPLARIETRWLDDPSLSSAAVASHVEASWVDTPSSGGTAIDADGNIYMGDADNRSILKISPDQTVTTLVADPRFIWTDAMWIDRKGFLWIPAAQLNRTKGMNDGKQTVHYPVWIYKMAIGAKPPSNDHS